MALRLPAPRVLLPLILLVNGILMLLCADRILELRRLRSEWQVARGALPALQCPAGTAP